MTKILIPKEKLNSGSGEGEAVSVRVRGGGKRRKNGNIAKQNRRTIGTYQM